MTLSNVGAHTQGQLGKALQYKQQCLTNTHMCV